MKKILFNKNKTLVVDENKLESKAILSTIQEMNRDSSASNIEKIIDYSSKAKCLIKVDNLTKTFKTNNGLKEVLRGINLNINENENVAILGGNGAGKTTLVEILVGLNKPTSGKIDFKYEYNKSHLEKIGIQFQDSTYPPGLTVKNIIDFILDVFGVKISKNELNGLIKIFGIDSFYYKRGSSLSGGQLQRLNAMIAILQKPKILFLDELSTGLDITIRTRIREFIKKFTEENNITIVLVSHDMGEVDYLCERIVFLKDGKIIVDTSKKSIIKKYGSIEKFTNQYIHGG